MQWPSGANEGRLVEVSTKMLSAGGRKRVYLCHYGGDCQVDGTLMGVTTSDSYQVPDSKIERPDYRKCICEFPESPPIPVAALQLLAIFAHHGEAKPTVTERARHAKPGVFVIEEVASKDKEPVNDEQDSPLPSRAQ